MKNTAVLRLHSGTRVLNGARFKITPIVKEGDGMMKKISTMLLCIILAGALACTSFAVIDIPTYKDSDRDEQDYDTGVFWVDDIDTYFRPGADYYLEVTWDGDEMTDEFFEQYTITQSIVSDTEGVSNSSVKSRLTAAEFVKGANGNYYYHIGISGTSRYSDALAQGEPVGLDDGGQRRGLKIVQRRLHLGKGLVCRGGDLITVHQILGKSLAALDNGGLFVGAEAGNARRLKRVDRAEYERIIRRDNGKIDRVCLCKFDDDGDIFGADGNALGVRGDAAVAGQGPDVGDGGTFAQLADDGMLAPARADNNQIHLAPPINDGTDAGP